MQIIHGFDSPENAEAWLECDLFSKKATSKLQNTWIVNSKIKMHGVA